MNKNHDTNQTLLQFVLRAQQLARHDVRSDRGYAMLVTSMISMAMLSMLAAYLTMTNITRSATGNYISSNSTFYSAESGLNARAKLIRQKVGSYDIPSSSNPPRRMSECIGASSTSLLQYSQPDNTVNDFGCKDYRFASQAGTQAIRVVANGDGSLETSDRQVPDNYISTTYVVDNPNRLATYPNQSIIPTGDPFAGMRMLEYTHRVYSTARRETAGTSDAPEKTVLQLDFQTRFVPMFQFAAFYDQDLEITPGPDMNINGRIHTNGNLHLTSNKTLCLSGSVSAQGNIYNRRKHRGNDSESNSNGLVYIYPNAGDCTRTTQDSNKRLWNPKTYTDSPLPNYLSPNNPDAYDSTNRTNMTARFGTDVVDGINNIRVPAPDFLAKANAAGALSTYYTKADLRIEAKSNPAATTDIFFNVTSIAQGMRATGDSDTCASFNVAEDKVGKATSRCMKFEAGQLQSLRQPVLVRTGQVTDDNQLCTTELTSVTATTSTAIAALTSEQKDKVARALQTAIVSQRSLVNYSDINSATKKLDHADFADIRTLFGSNLTKSGITSVTASNFDSQSLASIVAIAGDCFKPSPIQTYTTFYNNREDTNLTTRFPGGGNIAMLQTNIESLTIWNRDGLYANLIVNAAGDPTLSSNKYQVQTDGDNSGQGNSARQQVFKVAAIPTNLATCNATDALNLCKKSFRHLGLGGADNSEGGLVFHMTVDANNSVGTTTAYPAKKSPYGFAITGGQQLPGALTIATDQAAYLQGDYNFIAGTGGTGNSYNHVTGSAVKAGTTSPWTVREISQLPYGRGGYKFPASILADTINVTSRLCIDGNKRLNCGVEDTKPSGNETTVNVAFLAGNDIMAFSTADNYSGGLHNYPRLHENWGGALNYRGSFVSLGAPLQVQGRWEQTVYSPPTRNWDYDTDFNDVANLPPLTPNMVYLRQRIFGRSYQN